MILGEKKNLATLIAENKKVAICIGVALVLVELQIFAVAALKSGEAYKLKLIDNTGTVIYEADGKNLSDFNTYYFERIHGPLGSYRKQLEKREVPFPFRAWFVAAVGIPIGLTLCFAFVVKACMALFYGGQKKDDDPDSDETSKTNLVSIISRVSRFNIFVIGALVLLLVISYWIIPNFATYLGRLGVDTIVRFKWFFLGTTVVLLGLVAWVIYLRYLLARRAVEGRVEVDKYRLQLEYEHSVKAAPQLEYHENEKSGAAATIVEDAEVIDVVSRKLTGRSR